MPTHMAVNNALAAHTARVGVIGLSGSGLRLARQFAAVGFPTLGYDADANVIARLECADNTGSAGVPEWTTDPERLKELDVVVVGIPVPVTPTGGADCECLIAMVGGIARRPQPGRLIALTTPIPPGTVRAAVIPALAIDGQTPGRDFLLAFSPDPEVATDERMPRVVGGFDCASAEAAAALFGAIHPTIFRVASLEAAEVCGLTKAAIRTVHTAAANELMRVCDRMGLNSGEILAAVGLNGLPYPLDQIGCNTAASLLAWGVRRYGASTRLIESAMEIHASVPAFVTGKVADALNTIGKPVKGSRIAVPGVIPPGSPASEIVTSLRGKGAVVTVDAPLIPEYLAMQDAVLLIVPLPVVGDINALVVSRALVIDGCGATRNVTIDRNKVVRI